MQREHIKGRLLLGVGGETHRNECVCTCVCVVYAFTHQMVGVIPLLMDMQEYNVCVYVGVDLAHWLLRHFP